MSRSGKRSHKRFTAEEIAQILEATAAGVPGRRIARRFGRTAKSIWAVAWRGKKQATTAAVTAARRATRTRTATPTPQPNKAEAWIVVIPATDAAPPRVMIYGAEEDAFDAVAEAASNTGKLPELYAASPVKYRLSARPVRG